MPRSLKVKQTPYKGQSRGSSPLAATRLWHRKYFYKHYRKNKIYYIQRAKQQHDALREVVQSSKFFPCVDCYKQFPPVCMDFDHVRGRKKFNISRVPMIGSLNKFLKEIVKCDLVCANCHRIRTAAV